MTQTWDEVHPPGETTTASTGITVRADWAAIPLRLMLGFGFMYHGYPKLFSMEGHEQFVGMLMGIGVPLPEVMAWVVGIVEFFGGLALVGGMLVVPVAFLGLVNMLVAMFTVHLEAGFNFMNIVGQGPDGPVFGMPGYEVNLLYIAGFLALMFAGAGPLSVDMAVRRARDVPSEPYVGIRNPPSDGHDSK